MSDQNSAQTFQDRIEQAISQAGGPAEIARKSNLSRRVIDKYRSGESDPSRQRLVALADAAGVTVEWLATGKGAMRAGRADDEKCLKDRLLELGWVDSRTVSTPMVPADPALAGPVPLDHDFGGEVCAAILELYRTERSYLSTGKIVAIALEKYDEIVASADTDAERRANLRLVLNQLRKDIRSGAASTSQGNRSA